MSNYVFLIDANKTPMNPIHAGTFIARLCPYSNGNGEIYPSSGKKRIGIKLKYIEKPIHRKDGYSYS